MRAIYRNINFDVQTLVTEELPYAYSYYYRKNELHSDVKDLFEFFSNNSKKMPIYTIREESCHRMEAVFDDTYQMMVDALRILFSSYSYQIPTFFDCEMLRKHPYFVDYARYTFNDSRKTGQAIYGRFDAAFDPKSETVTGIYEFNADTPVMLFESVHLQDRIIKAITGDHEAQYNSYYPLMQENLKNSSMKSTNIAVMFAAGYVEDMATCETMAQILGEHNNCVFATLDKLDYDYSERRNPFVVGDTYLDTVFMLLPWEEMVCSFPTAFKDWKNWGDTVTFLEPAWRWFLSHKGIWAWITYLMEKDSSFKAKWSHLPVLKTYLTADPFIAKGEGYVSKPAGGRMSANVTFYNADGSVRFKSDGCYEGTEMVYQELCAPCHVEGRNNFIIGMFMAPTYVDYKADAATFCIREFESPVLKSSNERFIPHIVEFEGNPIRD